MTPWIWLLVFLCLSHPMQPRDPRRRPIVAHPERPFGGLDLVADAPARDGRGDECRIWEIDRERIGQHAAHPRQGDSPAKSVFQRPTEFASSLPQPQKGTRRQEEVF